MTALTFASRDWHRWFLPAVAVLYLVLGFALYAPILSTYFVADDFSYLDAISNSKSPAIIVSALADRYFRPMVVLVYYLNYKFFGLAPLTYHASVVLIHVVNAWLILLLCRALRAPKIVGPLAGLLFLVFGGHAEAVTWIGGMADPLVTLFALAAMLLFVTALDGRHVAFYLIGTWLACAAALLAKESAAIVLGLLTACAALARPEVTIGRLAKTLGIALAGVAVLLAAYFMLRRSVLGFTFVNLEGLGTNTNLTAMGRAFVLRSFLPHGRVLSLVFDNHLDVWVVLPLTLVLLWRLTRLDYRPLVLILACLAMALAPVMPLSISMVTPESERLIYMASAFASMLLVWFLAAALRQPTLLTVIVLLLAMVHVRALVRVNRNWQQASAITVNILTTFGEAMRSHGRVGSPVFVLNAPDSVNGAYIFRRGFHEALRTVAPDQGATMAETHVLSVHSILDPNMPIRAARVATRTVEIQLGGGYLLGTPNPPTPTTTLRDWAAQSFVVDFTPVADGGLVLLFTPEGTEIVGRLPL